MSPKQNLLAAFAGVARALGSAHRLDLLEHLMQGEKCVEALAARADLTVANASQHLQALRRAGLVSAERRGRQIVYRTSGDDVLDLVAALRTVGERRNASVQKIVNDYFHNRDQFEAVSLAEVVAKLTDGLVTLIDVRPPDEFAADHVAGAISVPLNELDARMDSLPADAFVVAYCRGPWCILAFEAVARLRRKGLTAYRLEGGLPEWRRAGLPVAKGLA